MEQRLVRFDGFEIDLQAREVRRGAVRLRLQEQPFQILAMMLERPGEVVTRDDIRLRLWPDGTIVDFEHSVNAAVKRLRAVLGDNADSPRYVETLHRRGYRLVAGAGWGKGPPPPPPPAAGPGDSQTPPLPPPLPQLEGRPPAGVFFARPAQ